MRKKWNKTAIKLWGDQIFGVRRFELCSDGEMSRELRGGGGVGWGEGIHSLVIGLQVVFFLLKGENSAF